MPLHRLEFKAHNLILASVSAAIRSEFALNARCKNAHGLFNTETSNRFHSSHIQRTLILLNNHQTWLLYRCHVYGRSSGESVMQYTIWLSPLALARNGHNPETPNPENSDVGVLANQPLSGRINVAASVEDDNQKGKRKSPCCPSIP